MFMEKLLQQVIVIGIAMGGCFLVGKGLSLDYTTVMGMGMIVWALIPISR